MVFETIVENFVTACYALDAHVPDYLDWDYGWAQEFKSGVPGLSLVEIANLARRTQGDLRAALSRLGSGERAGLYLRSAYLRAQLRAIEATACHRSKVIPLSGTEQLKLIYDVSLPRLDDEEMATIVEGYYGAIRENHGIDPRSQLGVARGGIMPTVAHIMEVAHPIAVERLGLHPANSVSLEAVVDEPWAAYNWFRGNAHSNIAVNVAVPYALPSVVSLALHEGMLGHHAHACSLEAHCVQAQNWNEFSLSPMLCANGPIHEGLAEAGMELLASSPSDLLDIVGGMVDVDEDALDAYYRQEPINDALAFNRLEIMLRLMNGEVSGLEADALGARFAPTSQRLSEDPFFERYGPYMASYPVGKAMVMAANPELSYDVHRTLLSTPRVPSTLGVDVIPTGPGLM